MTNVLAPERTRSGSVLIEALRRLSGVERERAHESIRLDAMAIGIATRTGDDVVLAIAAKEAGRTDKLVGCCRHY